VCGHASSFVFEQSVLGERVAYFDCMNCGYLQTETPHWLDRAYGRAINDFDTGIMTRNLENVGRVVMTLAAFGRLHGRVVDHAGGYGILVRLLRDAGVDAYWRDRYCENLLARGFEADDRPADLLTAFEVLEHLVDPLADLRRMLQEAPVVLLTTELVPTAATPARNWWYLGIDHGQHIGFFRERTLIHIAGQLGVHVASNGRSVHVLARRPVPACWRATQRAGRFWRLLARLSLRSRTMQDVELLRQRSVEATEQP
jgi:hypothetical protein